MFEQTVFNGGKVHAGSQAGFEECLVDLVMRATGEAAAMNEEDQWAGPSTLACQKSMTCCG